MSTLRVTNVQDTAGANSLTTAQIYNGAAKAWVNFNGTGTVAIRASFNVSSITDNGSGSYTVNFTTALADANYTMSGSGRIGDGFDDANIGIASINRSSTGPYSTTSCAIRFAFPGIGANATFFDPDVASAVFFR
jgi:hypothetical protein